MAMTLNEKRIRFEKMYSCNYDFFKTNLAPLLPFQKVQAMRVLRNHSNISLHDCKIQVLNMCKHLGEF